jgi:hypothetical protein
MALLGISWGGPAGVRKHGSTEVTGLWAEAHDGALKRAPRLRGAR